MARGKFSFWLDFKHDDSLLIAETIDELKARRSYSAVIRDGIMIVNELRQGRVDLLLKLYPWVMDAIAELLPKPEPPSGDDDIKRQIADLKRLILEQGSLPQPPADYPQMKSLSAGVGSTLGIGKKMTLPVFDDDDEGATLILSKSSTGNNGSNLLGGILAL